MLDVPYPSVQPFKIGWTPTGACMRFRPETGGRLLNLSHSAHHSQATKGIDYVSHHPSNVLVRPQLQIRLVAGRLTEYG